MQKEEPMGHFQVRLGKLKFIMCKWKTKRKEWNHKSSTMNNKTLPLNWDQKASMSLELLDTSCGGEKIKQLMVKTERRRKN